MSFTQAIFEALESLNGNKMRSGLTVLGIVIGVAAVIAMLAVGNGAQASITGSISSIGTNLLFVFSGSPNQEGPPGSGGRSGQNERPLTLGDANALLDQFAAPSVEMVAPAIQGNGLLNFSSEKTTTSISGVTPEYYQVRNLELTEGEFINQEHILGRMSVVVLGPETAITLFGHADGVVGEVIRIEGQPFRIIGVLVARGGGAFGSEDNAAYIPFTTAQARLIKRSTRDQVDVIFVQATTAEAVPTAVEEISSIIRQRHRTPVGLDDFTVFTQQDFLSIFSQITGVLTIFLGGIAGISLLVGGIGIMNMMLTTVTERTREIGLRKAIGAKRRDINIQFLAEAIALTLVGGVIGITLGWLISSAVNLTGLVTTSVSFSSVAIAFGVSALTGIVFGYYPAKRAAELNPIDALRYE